MNKRISDTVGADPARQWQGVYLGRVTKNRYQDLWIKCQVPQILGTAESNWAAPMLDPRQGKSYQKWSFEVPCGCDVPCDIDYPPGPALKIGTLVLVMFIGGDINVPVYMLYGLDSGRQPQVNG
jgi:hypothetical protein